MSERLPYWVDMDFSSDHSIVRSARNPAFSPEYDDRYYVGPYPTLTEAKDHIRLVSRVNREAISDKLNYWMERTVADIPVLDALTEETK